MCVCTLTFAWPSTLCHVHNVYDAFCNMVSSHKCKHLLQSCLHHVSRAVCVIIHLHNKCSWIMVYVTSRSFISDLLQETLSFDLCAVRITELTNISHTSGSPLINQQSLSSSTLTLWQIWTSFGGLAADRMWWCHASVPPIRCWLGRFKVQLSFLWFPLLLSDSTDSPQTFSCCVLSESTCSCAVKLGGGGVTV